MRVERLELLAYGHYTGGTLELSRPARGLTVVWGPNEAGKSTARRALLAALFGFERDDPGAFRHGRHGMRLGAVLSAADGRRVSFVREGMSKLRDPEGDPLEEAAVRALSGTLDRELCRRLFSIGHEELRTGSEALLEADGEIGRLVYGASLGAGSVGAVLRGLDERAGRLFQERGRAQRIPKALDAHRDGMRAAQAARVRAREFEQRQRDLETARAQLGAARAEFETARAEEARLERIRATRPLLARRAEVLDELGALGGAAPASWAARAEEAVASFLQARGAHELAVAHHDRLAAEVTGVEVPGALLERAARIDRLVEGIGRYRKDTEDLPERRAELEAAEEAALEQVRLLGLEEDDGRIVGEAELTTLEGLIRAHVELQAGGVSAGEELERAVLQVGAARQRLEALPEPREVAPLERALQVARQRQDGPTELARARAAQAAAWQDLRAGAGRLGLDAHDLGQIEALPVPTQEELAAEARRRSELRLERARVADERERLEQQRRAEGDELARLGTALPDPERLASLRRHRDAGWQAVLRRLEGDDTPSAWAGAAPLADAYADAVADADAAADERYEHAEGLALLEEHRRRAAAVEQALVRLEGRAAALEAAAEATEARWVARWAALGVEAHEPEEMAAWCRSQAELVDRLTAWRARDAELAALAGEIERDQATLAEALAAFGHPSDADRLDLLVLHAEAVVATSRAADDERRGALVSLRLAEETEPERRAGWDRHERALAAWREAWANALAPLSLAPTVTPEAAGIAVTALRSLFASRSERRSLERRIAGIERDRRSYEHEVDAVLDELAAVGIEVARDGAPLGAVALLQGRLGAARAGEQRRAALDEQLEAAATALRRTLEAREVAAEALEALRSVVGLAPRPEAPDEGVGVEVERARAAAALCQKLAEIEGDLRDQGDGQGIDELEAAARAASPELAGAIAGAGAAVAAAGTRLEAAVGALSDAERALEAITDAATAADHEQDAQGELALAARLAGEYARAALAAQVLRLAMRDYAERHRGPLLTRAGELFAGLTEDRFVRLVADADGERQVLLAERHDGELCPPVALSDGTRDQLYLALRLAALEGQLDSAAEAPPVVLDDILVHFDDARAAAALRALGGLGARTQTLLFTHHERVVELAVRELSAENLAVVRLSPRP